jgi:hypothetical protein
MAYAVIVDTDSQKVKNVNSVGYPLSEIIYKANSIKINEVLPFRVRFTTIGIVSANANVPGIGLQVIGVNNYIL